MNKKFLFFCLYIGLFGLEQPLFAEINYFEKREEEREKERLRIERERLKREEEERIKQEREKERVLAEEERLKKIAAENVVLSDPSEVLCESFKQAQQESSYLRVVVDWLNSVQIGSFYQSTIHALISEENYFNSIDSLNQFNLSVEPYGFDSSFEWMDENFQLRTVGVAGGANFTLKDRWVLGLGGGYFHSKFKWGSQDETKINSLYFGPQVTYLLNQGYLQLMVAGIYNMYEIDSEWMKGLPTESHENTNWDLLSRISGGLNIHVPFFGGATFFLQPNTQISYVGVLPHDYQEKGVETLKIFVKQGYFDFLRSRLALQFWKEFYKKDLGFLIPSFSVGWQYMQPLSQGEVTLKCKEESDAGVASLEENSAYSRYPKSSQLYIEGKLTAIHKRGFLLALNFEASIAEFYPVYLATARFEIDW
ncbi:MAG TPA: autotransporter outer membrane beta-barrel domain-containing protein [Rhabdochlamydiaceae bacterium]|nr:autotransporter outer membrane beta-barrel domain-containing protein [Rhabdochlamydiaceae bacterium]